jgi:anti-sigma B factor antagonist
MPLSILLESSAWSRAATALRESARTRSRASSAPTVLVVRLAGELDLYNAQEVREALLECCAEGPSRLVVDLSGVKFIDSTALGVLIEARTRLPNRKSFLLAAPGLETRRALEISGLDRHFSVHESVDEARAVAL